MKYVPVKYLPKSSYKHQENDLETHRDLEEFESEEDEE